MLFVVMFLVGVAAGVLIGTEIVRENKDGY